MPYHTKPICSELAVCLEDIDTITIIYEQHDLMLTLANNVQRQRNLMLQPLKLPGGNEELYHSASRKLVGNKCVITRRHVPSGSSTSGDTRLRFVPPLDDISAKHSSHV